MTVFELEKVVAVCFLESTKLVLQSLGKYRIELSEQGVDAPESLAHKYGVVRRLRDYLQRSIGAYPDTVPVELVEEDANTLVSCAARAIEHLDFELDSGNVSSKDREWLEQKRDTLIEWAVEFATEGVLELPGPKPHAVPSQGMKKLQARIAAKVYGTGTAASAGSPGGGLVKSFYEGAAAAPAAPGQGFGQPTQNPSFGQPAATAGFGEPAHGSLYGAPAPEPAPANPMAPLADPVPREDSRLVDPRVVRDARLRPILAMDLKALDRALGERDHRMAMVHLATIVEIVALDQAIPRREELGLVGPPDSWDLRAVLDIGLGGDGRFLPLLNQLAAAADLTRPARQLMQPMVVTAETVDRAVQGVRQVLKELGFSGRQGSTAGGAGDGSQPPPAPRPAPNPGGIPASARWPG